MANRFRNQALKEACLRFATKDESTVRTLHDSREFDELDAGLVRELFISAQGSGKRRRVGEMEFSSSTLWEDLSSAQLQRACDERGISTLGDRDELVARLN